MKYTIAFALAAMLVAVSASAASACPPCPDGMIQVNMNTVWVVGDGCHGSGQVTDWTNVKIKAADTYDVYGYAKRGNPQQCQTSEEYFVSIGGVDGPVSLDDAAPCAITERLDFLGTFDLVKGKNKVTMTTAAQCPPDETPNSVELERLCIMPTPPSAPEFPVPALASASVLAAVLAAVFVARKK